MFLSDPFKMMISYYVFMCTIFLGAVSEKTFTKSRKRRYLVFTKSTQYGVFATMAAPIYLESEVSVGWFYEANYYNVDNTSYYEPLLGDIYTARNRKERAIEFKHMFSRSSLYTFIETNLEKHGYPGNACLLRAICENAEHHFLQNGLLGDLIYLILTPSASLSEEEIEDTYYEAEYYGLENKCHYYKRACPSSPLDEFSMHIDDLIK